MHVSARGESRASSASRRSWRVLIIANAIASHIAGICYAQTFFDDFRNLDDTNVKSHFAPPAYRSLEEWLAARNHIRRQILVSAGLVPVPERNPLNARRTSRRPHADFYIEKVLIEPLPGFQLAGNLYVPSAASPDNKAPAVLVPHGHWRHGRAHQTPVYSVPALCANLASQGYVAFTWDMIGYGDTRQLPHHFGGSARDQLWSFSLLGLQLWDSIRALDFLESLPEVDADHIGITGSSGGGTQTFLLAAVDDRIKAAAPVDMVSAIFQGDDLCEEAPGLRIGTNNMEIAAMMAPKPLLLVASTRDPSSNTPTEEFPAVRSIYALYGRPDLVGFALIDAEHNFNRASRESVYRFFANHLRNAHPQPEAPAYQETFLERIASEELVFGDKSEHLIGAPGYQQIFSTWKESAERQTRSMTGKELRDRMQLTLGVDWPDNAQTMFAGEQMLITRNRGDRMPVRWLAGTREGQAALVVNPSGSEAAYGSSFVRATEAQGVSLLLLDAYQTGVARAPVVRRPGDSLTYHRTDDQNRVQDILTGIAWLHERALGSIRLHCNGRASAWCLLAAAVTPVPVILDIEPVPAPSTDDELKRLVFIPGLQRAGGLRVAHLLAEPAAPAESAFFR